MMMIGNSSGTNLSVVREPMTSKYIHYHVFPRTRSLKTKGPLASIFGPCVVLQKSQLLIVCTLLLFTVGCASTFRPSYADKSDGVPPAGNPENLQTLDLRKYDIATITTFKVGPNKGIDPVYGKRFAAEVFGRLKNGFTNLFPEIRFGDPKGATNELVITGTIRDQSMASLRATLTLIDQATHLEIFQANITESGGTEIFMLAVAPAAMPGDQKFLKAAASIASTIAYGRGWRPTSLTGPHNTHK